MAPYCDYHSYLATLVCIAEQPRNDYVSVLTHRHVLVSRHIMVYILYSDASHLAIGDYYWLPCVA